jgi:hypothetical protein
MPTKFKTHPPHHLLIHHHHIPRHNLQFLIPLHHPLILQLLQNPHNLPHLHPFPLFHILHPRRATIQYLLQRERRVLIIILEVVDEGVAEFQFGGVGFEVSQVVGFEELGQAHLADAGHAAPAGVGGVGDEEGLAGAVGEPEGVGEVVFDGEGGGGGVAG